jgi:hypothetical protein
VVNIKQLFLFSISIAFFASCSDDGTIVDPVDPIDPVVELVNPVSYDFTRNGASTISFSGQTERIGMATEMVNALSNFQSTEEQLLEMYANQTASGGDANPYTDSDLNASSKSVKSKVAASKDFFSSNTVESAEIKAALETLIIAQVSEVFPNQNELAAEGAAGQIADGSSVRYVSAGGLEYNQAVSKSLIGALMVDQMLNNYLSPSVLDEGTNVEDNNNGVVAEGQVYTNMEHKWDEAFGYIFGAPGADYADPLNTLGGDSFLNKYLSRVEGDDDFAGIASEIFEALKLGRAAIVALDYDLRDEQADIITDRVSEVVGVRAVYYLQQGKNALARNDFGAAFHDLSEGYGFVFSLRFLRDSNTDQALFSKSEVDGFINQLTQGSGFWGIDAATLDQLSNDIAAKFDFSVEQAGS